MTSLLVLTSILGGAALLLRLLRTLLRVALRSAEITSAAGLTEVSLRRGDLTGMTERKATEVSARRARRRDLLLTTLWLLWLFLPAAAGYASEAYAAAAPLWLLPRPKVRESSG